MLEQRPQPFISREPGMVSYQLTLDLIWPWSWKSEEETTSWESCGHGLPSLLCARFLPWFGTFKILHLQFTYKLWQVKIILFNFSQDPVSVLFDTGKLPSILPLIIYSVWSPLLFSFFPPLTSLPTSFWMFPKSLFLYMVSVQCLQLLGWIFCVFHIFVLI